MPLDPNDRYNANCFAIAPQREAILLRQESNVIVSPQQNYKVFNIGRSKVFVELLFGSGWRGRTDTCTVEPGETKILNNRNNACNAIALKVFNQTDVRAIIHASTADGNFPVVVDKEPGLYNYEYYNKLKELFCLGVKYTPYHTTKFRGLLEAFWPLNKQNIWEQIEVKLEPLLETHILDEVRGFLNSFIKDIGDRLETFVIEFEQGRQAANYYMNIAEDLEDFEQKFIYRGNSHHYYKTISKFLLPLYSSFILMKITYYTLGITCAKGLGLTAYYVEYVKNQIKIIIEGNGATKYVDDMLIEWVRIVYDTCHPEDIYNTMMNTRSLIGLHGTEYSTIWNNMMKIPSTTGEKVYNDVISYSVFFGRPTACLYKEAISETMLPPLTPCFVGFRRNSIRYVEMFLWRKSPSSSPKIGGARIVLKNDDVYVMGTVTEEVEQIDFNEERILKLIVTGDGAIDSCHFYMSDNREFYVGTRESGASQETFELKDHHIISFFLSSDSAALGGQAANIAVAYRLNDDLR